MEQIEVFHLLESPKALMYKVVKAMEILHYVAQAQPNLFN